MEPNWDNHWNSLAVESMRPGVEPRVECPQCGRSVHTLHTCIVCGERGCLVCMAQTEGGDDYCRDAEECERLANRE